MVIIGRKGYIQLTCLLAIQAIIQALIILDIHRMEAWYEYFKLAQYFATGIQFYVIFTLLSRVRDHEKILEQWGKSQQ